MLEDNLDVVGIFLLGGAGAGAKVLRPYLAVFEDGLEGGLGNRVKN